MDLVKWEMKYIVWFSYGNYSYIYNIIIEIKYSLHL